MTKFWKDVILTNMHFGRVSCLSQEQSEAKQEILHKIETGIYNFEEIDCPICGGSQFTILAERCRYGLPVTTCCCRQCGFVLSNPRLDKDSLEDFYTHHYRSLYMAERSSSEEAFKKKKEQHGLKVYRQLQALDSHFFDSPKVVFDVGCGDGSILQYFAEQGHACFGFDLDPTYGEKTQHLRSFSIFAENFSFSEEQGQADLIISNRSLEHISDVRSFLGELHKALSNDGMLYISVPSIVKFQKSPNASKISFLTYLHPAHIYHFSLKSLTNLMNEVGFTYLSGDEDGCVWSKRTEPYHGTFEDCSDEVAKLVWSQRHQNLLLLRNRLRKDYLLGLVGKFLRSIGLR